MIPKAILHACAAAALAAPLAGQSEPIIQLSDHSFLDYNVSEAYPQGIGPFTGEIVGADQPIVMELRYNVPVQVRLVGATTNDRLALRQANGAVTTVTVLCSWSDPDLPANQRTWNSFPCYASGTAGPPAPTPGVVRRVLLRTFAVTLPAAQGTAAAGFYSTSVFFRVDAR
jgi:hypothetical protein